MLASNNFNIKTNTCVKFHDFDIRGEVRRAKTLIGHYTDRCTSALNIIGLILICELSVQKQFYFYFVNIPMINYDQVIKIYLNGNLIWSSILFKIVILFI